MASVPLTSLYDGRSLPKHSWKSWRQAGQRHYVVGGQVWYCWWTQQTACPPLCQEHRWCFPVFKCTGAASSEQWCWSRTFSFWTGPSVQDPVWWQPSFLPKNSCFLWLEKSKTLIQLKSTATFTMTPEKSGFQLCPQEPQQSYPAYQHTKNNPQPSKHPHPHPEQT